MIIDIPVQEEGTVKQVSIETAGEVFGFICGDIITCTCGKCSWDNQHVLVRGFDLGLQGINGLVIPNEGFGPIDYDDSCEFRSSGDHLEIVRYARVLFRGFKPLLTGPPQVNDEVIAIRESVEGCRGRVIAVDLREGRLNPYLVDFQHYRLGHSSIELFSEF